MDIQGKTELREEDKINLEAVYKELTRKSIFRTKETTNLLTSFASLIASKSSFAHKVHKAFSNMPSFPKEN